MGCSSAESKENCITAEFYIDEKNVNEEVQIIDSIEHFNSGRTNVRMDEEDKKEFELLKNEEEIKKCTMSINNKVIPFCYKYKFPAPGNYTIKYTFQKPLIQTSFMFNDCVCLKKVDLSKFDTSNLTRLMAMFQTCENLESITFFNSPIEKVTNMNFFLMRCSKIKSISLSNFNKEITVTMDNCFTSCKKLETVDLSNFKAKVVSASYMFNECDRLKKLDLSGLVSTDESRIEDMFFGIHEIDKNNLVIKDQNILKIYDGGEGRVNW